MAAIIIWNVCILTLLIPLIWKTEPLKCSCINLSFKTFKLIKYPSIYFKQGFSFHFLSEGNRHSNTVRLKRDHSVRGNGKMGLRSQRWRSSFIPTIKEMERAGRPKLFLIVMYSSFLLFAFLLFSKKKGTKNAIFSSLSASEVITSLSSVKFRKRTFVLIAYLFVSAFLEEKKRKLKSKYKDR